MKGEKYLFVVSAPSGTGKDTVVRTLQKNHPDVRKTISATTRAPREKKEDGVSVPETDGKDYYFMTDAQFRQAVARGEMVEHACFCGNCYGTLRSEIEPRMESGTPVILVIEVEGAGNIKRQYPGATTIFIMPPSMEELEKRLRSRGSETEEEIRRRLHRAESEIPRAADYDEQVVNDVMEVCADEIYRIIRNRIAAEA